MGIMAIRLGRKHKLANVVVTIGCLFYIVGSFVFVVLYRNSRFLRRIQSKIWKVNSSSNQLQPTGRSYKDLNPAYTSLDFKTKTSNSD